MYLNSYLLQIVWDMKSQYKQIDKHMNRHKWLRWSGSHCVKNDFPAANFSMHMFNMSLMNMQSIIVCQQIFQVILISICKHYLRCNISEHTKLSSQELPKIALWKKFSFDENTFLSILLLLKMFNVSVMRMKVSNCFIKYFKISWFHRVCTIQSWQSNFSRRTKGINSNGMNA